MEEAEESAPGFRTSSVAMVRHGAAARRPACRRVVAGPRETRRLMFGGSEMWIWNLPQGPFAR